MPMREPSMPTPEPPVEPTPGLKEPAVSRLSRTIIASIRMIIECNTGADKETEQEMAQGYDPKVKSARERAVLLYEKIVLYSLLKQQNNRARKESPQAPIESDPDLISEIKVLAQDQQVMEIVARTLSRARLESKIYRLSQTGHTIKTLVAEIQETETKLDDLEQQLFLERDIASPIALDRLRSTIERLARRLREKKRKLEGIERLDDLPKTKENTDIVAMLSYERFMRYRDQFDTQNGFVWFETREEIDRKAMEVLNSGNPKQTRKGIFFISEPGTGKTEQIRAIAQRLTGEPQITIDCDPRMGKVDLLAQEKVFPGATQMAQGTYKDYENTVAAAWTGYDYSFQEKPVRDRPLVVELNELPKAFGNDRVFATLKNLFSLKDGAIMPGSKKPVLPGRVLIASGNLGQLHDAKKFPPALEREFVVIPVDYIDMTKQRPEGFQFMIIALIIRSTSKDGHINASRSELFPAYQNHVLPEAEQEKLPDRSVIIARDELIPDPTDIRHGFVYRLAHAVKAVQNSYMARGGENAYINYTARPLLRYKEGDAGVSVTNSGGEAIILGTTITVDDMRGWMVSFQQQRMKSRDSKEPPVTLTQWVQLKLREKMGSKHEDSAKLKAIFDHFHLLDESPASTEAEDPLTPLEIGYLDPRVPRPAVVKLPEKKSADDAQPDNKPAVPPKPEAYATTEVLLDSSRGEKVLIKAGEATFKTLLSDAFTITPGIAFMVGEQRYTFAGVVEEPGSIHHGKLVGSLVNEKELHQLFTPEEVEDGILKKEFQELKENIELLVTAGKR